MIKLATAYLAAGKFDLAQPLYEETLALMKVKLGPDHPDTLNSMNHLAISYRQAGKLDLALPLHEEALGLLKAKLGPDHPATSTAWATSPSLIRTPASSTSPCRSTRKRWRSRRSSSAPTTATPSPP